MIKNYQKFLIRESIKQQIGLLLEAQFSSTSGFLDKLRKISKDKSKSGKIAQVIYDMIDDGTWVDDEHIKQNYFDVTDKDDKVSFIMQSKVDKEDWDEENDPSLPYNIKGRGEIGIGKTIKYILDVLKKNGDLDGTDSDFKDKDIEQFVNLYKATKSSSNFKFKELKGEDISKYYNQKRYYSGSGSLGGSCMSEESKGTFKIYYQNESKVKLLVFIDEESDKISGRALIWKLTDSPCEAKYFMDRVYTNSDSDFFKFREYAEEKGYLYKFRMNSYVEDNVHFRYKGSDVFGEISVKLDGSARTYPFVDTLCFMNKEETMLSNVPFKDCYMLHSVGGDCEPCDRCGGKVIDCDWCFNDETIECEDCSGSGDSDSGKCVTCKGKGELKCEHESARYCYGCGEGLQKLKEKGIKLKIGTQL
jgi:hypothetical protein